MTKTRYKLTLALIAMLLMVSIGCSNNPKPTTLPAGATSAADATSYRVLADAQAFLNSIQDSVKQGKLTLSPAQKTAYNDVTVSYNAAEATWQLCHAGGCSSQQQQNLADQTNQLNVKLTTAQKAIAGQ